MSEKKRIYDELPKIVQKHEYTIIVPTQPKSERNYINIYGLKDRPNVLVIDYFDKI